MEVTFLRRHERRGAGVNRWGREFIENLRRMEPGMKIAEHRVRKFEFNLLGKPRFGYASMVLGRLAPFKSNGGLVHVLDPGIIPFSSCWANARPFDVVTLFDPFPWTEPSVYQTRVSEAVMFASIVPSILRTRFIVTCTRYVQHIIEDLFDRHDGSIIHIPAGVNTHFWRPLPKERKSKPSILVVGADYPRKNLIKIVDACCLLDGVTLRLIGAWRFNSIQKTVYEHAEKAGLDIEYLGWLEDDPRMLEEYNRATVVCSAALDEGFGLVPVEAMACGTPVVLSDIQPHREVNGPLATYFDPTDPPEEIASILDASLHTETDRERLVRSAARYSWERIIPRWLELYREIYP